MSEVRVRRLHDIFDGFTIDAVLHRRDGGTGSTRVSSAMPLREGDLVEAALNTFSVWVGGTEQEIHVEALDMLPWPDGSLRGVHLQLDYDVDDGTDVACEIRIGNVRGTSDITPTDPAPEDPSAACIITDADYLCETKWFGLLPGLRSEAWIDTNLDALWQNMVDLLKTEVAWQWSQFTGGSDATRNGIATDGGGYDMGWIAVQAYLLTGDPDHWDAALDIAEWHWSGHTAGSALGSAGNALAHVHNPRNAIVRYLLAGSSAQRTDADNLVEVWLDSHTGGDGNMWSFEPDPTIPEEVEDSHDGAGSTYFEGRTDGKALMILEMHKFFDPDYVPYSTVTVTEWAESRMERNIAHEETGGPYGGGAGTGLNIRNHGDMGVKMFMEYYRHLGYSLHRDSGGLYATEAEALTTNFRATLQDATVATSGDPTLFDGDVTFPNTYRYHHITVLDDPPFDPGFDVWDTSELNTLAVAPWAIDHIRFGTADSWTRIIAATQEAYDGRGAWESTPTSISYKFMHQVFEPLHLLLRAAVLEAA